MAKVLILCIVEIRVNPIDILLINIDQVLARKLYKRVIVHDNLLNL